MANCTLVLDSCCDLPMELVDREDVLLIRFPFFFGEEEHLDDLWDENDPREFYGRMRKGEMPTTSQAAMPHMLEVFDQAAATGKPCVYLSFTSGMSGHFQSALIAAEQARAAHPGFDLRVVDTLLASTAQSVISFEALNRHEQGATADELEKWALEARYRANVLFMVSDLESLHRGGRIPKSVAVVGSKLDVKPLVTIDAEGKLAVKGVARGRKKGIKQLAKYYLDNVDHSAPPFVHTGNSDCPKDMKKLQETIADESEIEPLFVERQIGPVIGSHVGPDMLSVCFWGRNRRAM